MDVGTDFSLMVLFYIKFLIQFNRILKPITNLIDNLYYLLGLIIGTRSANRVLFGVNLIRIIIGVMFVVHYFCNSWMKFAKSV